MILNFDIYEARKGTDCYNALYKFEGDDANNEYLLLGEVTKGEKDYYKIINLQKGGLRLIGGLKLDTLAIEVPKADLKMKSNDGYTSLCTAMDVPKEYLTLELIEDIQRLND